MEAMTMSGVAVPAVLGLKVGELVEVRSPEEIRATLDENGELQGLPFMPEMLAFCGQRLTVNKVAHKACDVIGRTGMRRMTDAVHLTGARCNGSAHGGCQTACTLYWKEQWLRRVLDGEPTRPTVHSDGRVLLPLLTSRTVKEPAEDGRVRFKCQATEMFRATPEHLPLREIAQYREDVTSGNATIGGVLLALFVGLFNHVQDWSRRLLPAPLRYRDGLHWRFLSGGITEGRTPTEILDLQPGELVRIKSREKIMATLDADLLNRGMGFDAEMSRFCGRTARVQSRATQCIDERTGLMLTMKSPCIILEGIFCEGAFTANCPRAYVCWWREIWLERVDEDASDART